MSTWSIFQYKLANVNCIIILWHVDHNFDKFVNDQLLHLANNNSNKKMPPYKTTNKSENKKILTTHTHTHVRGRHILTPLLTYIFKSAKLQWVCKGVKIVIHKICVNMVNSLYNRVLSFGLLQYINI